MDNHQEFISKFMSYLIHERENDEKESIMLKAGEYDDLEYKSKVKIVLVYK